MHIPAISHREHEPHRHFPRPPFQGHPLGFGLDDLQGRAVRKFERAKMGDLNLSNPGEHVEQAGKVGVAKRMQGKGLHRATVHGLGSIARTK